MELKVMEKASELWGSHPSLKLHDFLTAPLAECQPAFSILNFKIEVEVMNTIKAVKVLFILLFV
jgi:hypothetical protein